MERQELGEIGDIEAVERLLPVAGRDLIDVGCGAGVNSRALAALGAQVLGVEPDPIQAAANREAELPSGLRFAEAPAEALPTTDASVDGVFFFRSLHHIPIDAMDRSLAEAARVLKPGTGFLAVVEPAREGNFFALTRLFNDETEVRGAAQAALTRTAARRFGDHRGYGYLRRPRFADFEALVNRMAGTSYIDLARERIDRPEVRAAFEAGATGDGYVFEQPMLLEIYRDPAPA